MRKNRYLKSGLSCWLLAATILGFFTNLLFANLQDLNYQFIVAPLEITPTEMLDAEQLVQQAKIQEQVSDTLWKCVFTVPDSEMATVLENPALIKKVSEGLEILSADLEKITRVRQIQRHFNELTIDDVRFVVHDLLESATDNLFKAKLKNPYQPYTEIATFQKILNTLIARNTENSEIVDFMKQCQNVPWLVKEKNELFVLNGTVFQYQNQWEKAFQCYKKAYAIVSQTVYPCGIDSAFAMKMDSIASKSFIAPERKLMADMLVKQALEIKAVHDSLRFFRAYFADSTNIDFFTLSDSLQTRQFVDKALNIIKVEDRFARKKLRKMKSRIASLQLADLDFSINQVFKQLETKMLEAKQLNPFDQNLRILLGRDIYFKTAENYQDSSLYAKSAQEFENLIWIKKGNFAYFLYLGDAYMGVKEWQKALTNFQIAEKTLIQTAILGSENPEKYIAQPDSAPVNYDILSHCVMRQGEANVKLYEGKEALKLFRRSYAYAQNSNRRTILQNYIDLVNWDEGNVLAMNLRKKANDLMKLGDYEHARIVSLELLRILWTDRTKDEINNQIALLDFQQLNRKEEGIERMRLVVRPMKKDSVGAAADPVNQKYFKNYGRMCYDFGLRYLVREEERKIAYIYFIQATQMKWYGRPKAYLQLASLSEFDPRESIRLGFNALKEADNLTPSEKRQVAELLSNAFQKEAKFKEARTWYRLSLDRAWCESRDQS